MEKPKEIEFGFEFDYKKIWELKIPVEEMDIDELKWNLDVPYLDKIGTDDWNLTPRELIANLERESLHFDALKKADLAYPIAIYYHAGKWKILDGIHRFCKAILNGAKTIKVKKVTEKMISYIKITRD